MEVNGQIHAPAVLHPRREPPVPIGQEAGWASEPVSSTLWRRENLTPAENQTPVIHPVARLYTELAIPTRVCYKGIFDNGY
jgi:hypothetical protein